MNKSIAWVRAQVWNGADSVVCGRALAGRLRDGA